MNARYDDGRDTPFFSQFTGAELMCDKYALARPELEVFAADSHRKAAVATALAAERSAVAGILASWEKSSATQKRRVDQEALGLHREAHPVLLEGCRRLHGPKVTQQSASTSARS